MYLMIGDQTYYVFQFPWSCPDIGEPVEDVSWPTQLPAVVDLHRHAQREGEVHDEEQRIEPASGRVHLERRGGREMEEV